MLSNRQVKLIQSLKQKKFRSEHQLFIAEGEKIAAEVLRSQAYIVDSIYATAEWLAKQDKQLIDDKLIIEVTEKELKKISALSTPNQVLTLLKMNRVGKSERCPWSIVVDTLQDPGNLGTIVRIADWFGINEVILSEGSVDIFNPKVIQATMGSFTRVSVSYQNLSEWLTAQKRVKYGAVLGGKNLYTTNFPAEGILLFGNESKGISDDLLTLIDHEIEIPRRGGAESLNVSVACSIFSNEVVRQSFLQ